MPIGMILHAFFAIFTYTSSEIYPYSVDSNAKVTVNENNSVSVFDAIVSRFGLIFLAIGVITIALILLREVLQKILKRVCGGHSCNR